MLIKFKFSIKIICLSAIISSCSNKPNLYQAPLLPAPLRQSIVLDEQSDIISNEITAQPTVPPDTIITVVASDKTESSIIVDSTKDVLPIFKTKQSVSINVESLPLPAFINELFGNILGLSFQIESALQNKKDLVTLRITEPQSPEKLYQTALQVLRDYGVIVTWGGDDLLKFSIQNQATDAEPPLLISGRALPEVPISHRPVFYNLTLKVIRANQMEALLRNFISDKTFNTRLDVKNNTLLLSGTLEKVKAAIEIIKFFDRPSVRSQFALKIVPAFLSAEELAKQLSDVLIIQGYYTGIGVAALDSSASIIFLPLKQSNLLFAFTSDETIFSPIKQWAKQLDIPPPQKEETEDKMGLFAFPVQHAPADQLAKILTPLLSALSQQPSGAKTNANLIVDSLNNVLLYQGQTDVWIQLRDILRQLDKPTKQVLVEVIVAEITLNDEERSGVEWLVSGLNLGSLTGTLQTLSGLGIGGNGLNYGFVNSLGQTRAILNAFASSSRVNILSSPRVMVKSGQNAAINVGSEVPVITSQSIDSTSGQVNGSSALLQQVQYRRTGINLQVKPVVYAGNRVDIELTQEVSQAEENATSSISSPVILNRSVTTQLSLNDGSSILLGGLMTHTLNQGWSGIPVLSDIPVLGNLFKTQRSLVSKTELMILIVPYVLGTDEAVAEITQLFQQRLQLETEWELSPLVEMKK